MPVLTTSPSAALAAADAQTIALPGETDTATLVKPTARKLLDLEIKDTDKLMAAQFRTHLRAKIVESLAGMCPGMGAEFIAITGGNLHTFATAGRLASHAGLVPYQGISAASPAICTGPGHNRRLRRVFTWRAVQPEG